MSSDDTAKRVLLPTDVKPIHYTLTITPDFEKFTFDGSEDVQFKLNTPTKIITMNAKYLEVHTAEVTMKTGKNLKSSKIDYDKDNEYVLIHFDEEIDDGSLKVAFTGELNDKMCGFYRSQYTKDGEKRFMGVTQFESTDARRAFPCWDEPAIKATFQINLIVPEDRTALSCMNIIEEQAIPEKKQKLVRFAETPIMSTYYLAWVVGELDYVEDKTTSGTIIRCYTPVGKQEQGKFALDVATRILPFFEDYFGEKFPLPKVDLVAIPDFAAGAMENWGCVTFRETAVLVDPKNSSTDSKQYVALVVCHELAHMWFGNLVTMEWWEHLWLNEGFATWVENLAVDTLFPEWKIWEQFVHSDYGRAQALDGLASSHPIEVEVSVASDIDQIFDDISYSKGCAVIRMLAEFLGMETFRDGLRVYLTRHKYGNASTGDLWKALSETSGKDVGAMMYTWTRQTGYPVLTITEDSSADTKDGNVAFKVEQSRFLDSGIATPEQDQALWHIPFGYVTSANPDKPTWLILKDKVSTVVVENGANLDWIKFNPQQTGFYRVAYPEKYLQKLIPAIESRALGDIDRLGIQNDVFSLARSGRIRTSHALAILKAYANETNYTVWADISTNVGDIWSLVAIDPEIAPKFDKFAQHLFTKKGAELGWEPKEGESHLTAMLRALMLRNLIKYNHAETIAEAAQRFQKFVKDPESVTPDLRSALYAAVIKTSGAKGYEDVLHIFRTTDLHEERIRCITSLGVTRDKKLLQRTLDFALSDEIRSQDTMYVLMGVSSNPAATAGDMPWDFFKQHFDEFERRYGEGGYLIGQMIKLSAEGVHTEERAAEVEEFFKSHPLPSARMPIEQCVESIRLNAAWRTRDREDIQAWLDANF